jgi:3-phenylpropionate/trans-cinnamate dioxygenase ferredoxin subunit
MNWTYVLDDAELHECQMTAAYPLGVNVVLARISGVIYAISGKCVHMACPLFTGKLEDYTVTCPCHDWQFDIRTGKFLDASELLLKIYPTNSVTDKIFINLNGLV